MKSPRLALSLLLALVVAGSAAAQQTRTRDFERTFPVDGRTVTLEGSSMDVEVRPIAGTQAQLVVSLEYWSNSEGWMEAVEQEFDVEVREAGGTVYVRPGDMPEQKAGWFANLFGNRQVNWSLHVSLGLPAGTSLTIENRYGRVDVRDLAGQLEIDNTSGEVDVINSGATRIANHYAHISVTGVTGDLEVRGNSADVTVAGVQGNADVSTTYAPLTVRNVTGSLRASAQSGELEVEDIGGDAELEGSYAAARIRRIGGTLRARHNSAEVSIDDVGGRAEVETSYAELRAENLRQGGELAATSGAVTVRGATGDLRVRNSYAPVILRDVSGNVEVESTSSSVTLEAIGGGVDVVTSYDGVVVRGAGGSVRVRNQSGRIEVDGLSGAALTASHELSTSYAGIQLGWPRNQPLSVDAECTYGSIRSDFEGTAEKRGSTERLTISETGGGSVRLSTNSGSITLQAR